MLIREGLKDAPTLYKKGTKRIKYKRIRNALQSDLENPAVDQGTGLICQIFTWIVNTVELM